MRGNTLANIRLMVKAEIGNSLRPGVALQEDPLINALIGNKQRWLATQWDWAFLETRIDQATAANTRYYPRPQGIVLERATKVECYYGNRWRPCEYGVGWEQYNAINPDLGLTQDPVRRWQILNAGATSLDPDTIEVWPVPMSPTMLRFRGQIPLPDLVNDDDCAAFDDVVLSLFTAAEMLVRRGQPDAQTKMQMAQAALIQLKGQYPRGDTMFVFGGGTMGGKPIPEVRPTVAVTIAKDDHSG